MTTAKRAASEIRVGDTIVYAATSQSRRAVYVESIRRTDSGSVVVTGKRARASDGVTLQTFWAAHLAAASIVEVFAH